MLFEWLSHDPVVFQLIDGKDKWTCIFYIFQSTAQSALEHLSHSPIVYFDRKF